ncbi:hypothetical protein [Methylobacter sp.]|uniref:hypothetical protein n=1 Tax=Methylobacter sp. TaxID=2051955 RepID=UPI0012211484|nr:hypothetical protein [Methylobacter sp.]TAK62069.1 MAG: hypothetical protein EPO18_11650 [Methylobacter sp.]
MLLKFKTNPLLISTLFFLGYTSILHADECGVLRYLVNKSNGITISGNTCKTADDIALGSEFNLMPGARLWFKSQRSADTQGICQNRSPNPIRISVNSDQPPWIKPSDLANCSPWTNNKMNCDDGKDGLNALSCVITTLNSDPHPKGLEQRTTSVRMRSLQIQGDPNKDEPSQSNAEADKEKVISAMQPDISLCRALNETDTHIKLTWLVDTNGHVNTVIPAADEYDEQNDADKLVIDCFTAVIKDFSYPQSSQAVWLSNQF